jgi:hypothetical protein
MVDFEPLTKQIRFNNALLAEVADPLVGALIPSREQIRVNGQITVP